METFAPAPAVSLETPRLVVRLAEDADVPEVVRYYADNREHLRPFDPARPALFYEERFWRTQVRQNFADFHADHALRLFLFPRDEPARIVGTASFSNFVRGVFHCCTLGYSLAEEAQGQGLMGEALQEALRYVFDHLRMHRVSANYMPHNRRSGRVLRRLGFVVEGYARDYLLIDGRWEDHVLTSLTNPTWRHPHAPS